MTVAVADAYVVDTGVFLPWFVDQDGFEHARELQRRLVDGSISVETVDFVRVEVAGVLRKKGPAGWSAYGRGIHRSGPRYR